MKLFLRGLLALALVAAFGLTATAGNKGSDCGCNGNGGAEKRGLFSKLGHRADHVAEGYIAANNRIGEIFSKLAGPPVDPVAGPVLGGKQKGGPHTQPGTVVFPQHPFARSPRDFFMDP